MSVQRLLVVGGNGFVGSAVCRAAVARGWEVVSLSRSGKPFANAKGHSPAWVKDVEWRAGSSFDPSTYAALLPTTTALVSTLGILLEGDYKSNGSVNPLGVLRGIAETAMGGRGNPLRSAHPSTYERMNRDAALSLFDAFAASAPSTSLNSPSPFVYLSAEDIFRPFISPRYIETKREAEQAILDRLASSSEDASSPQRSIRPVFVRPSLIYHPHVNPMSTLPATVLDVSSRIQSLLPPPLRASHIFPSSASRLPLPPASTSLASLLTVPPIHVDTIAQAICSSISDDEVEGVVDVRRMRRMAGFDDAWDKEAAGAQY